MKDISTIDWNESYSKRVSSNPATQKVYFIQNGIEYGSDGKACNAKQIKEFYANQAAEAQKLADEAKEAAAEAHKQADALLKAGGTTKTAARKAAG